MLKPDPFIADTVASSDGARLPLPRGYPEIRMKWPEMERLESDAFTEAQKLGSGYVGPEHLLLALLATPNVAADALADVGITYKRVVEQQRSVRPDPDLPVRKPKGLSPNPAAVQLVGYARGFAAAAGHPHPKPENWLLAMLFVADWIPNELYLLGVSAQVAVDALEARRVRVPGFPPVEFEPPRGYRHVYVSLKELPLIRDVLLQRHPPGSEWQWGFNYVGKPPRGRISAEEGIDLEAIVEELRAQLAG
jgi:hypothetical protein